MQPYERIKMLRKSLHLSREAFGKRLGVTGDIISNIELNRLAKPEKKLSLIKLMAKEFSVNEKWILNGTEPMYAENKFNLDDFLKEYNATDTEIKLVKAYFQLDSKMRKLVIDYFTKQLQNRKTSEKISEKEELDKKIKNKTIEELEEEYKKRVLKSAAKQEQYVSNSTDADSFDDIPDIVW